jgi:hypothetical protein
MGCTGGYEKMSEALLRKSLVFEMPQWQRQSMSDRTDTSDFVSMGITISGKGV